MPALIPTEFIATVTWLGINPDRAHALHSAERTTLELSFDGPTGESHAGRTRASDARVVAQHPKGTTIANVRQISIISQEDLEAIAATMNLECLDPTLFGASMMVSGLPDFSLIPPSSRLQDEATGATVVIDMENHPCHLISREIEGAHPGYGKLFKPAAKHRRGVTAWVEREGKIALGATMRLHIPGQPAWPQVAT